MVPKGDPELGRGLWKCFFAHVLESFEEVSFTGPKDLNLGLGLLGRSVDSVMQDVIATRRTS